MYVTVYEIAQVLSNFDSIGCLVTNNKKRNLFSLKSINIVGIITKCPITASLHTLRTSSAYTYICPMLL